MPDDMIDGKSKRGLEIKLFKTIHIAVHWLSNNNNNNNNVSRMWPVTGIAAEGSRVGYF